MNNLELVQQLKNVAENYKTLYVMGCFGAPMSATNKKRYTTNHSYNKQPARTKLIQAASADTFGFDCVCLIKGVLWGWCGDKTKHYGGAAYASNNVPDIGADGMIGKCSDLSTDFSKIEIGEAVWMKGHIGVYIGDGLAVECSPKWANGVQITACNCNKSGYNRRDWTKHGKLPYINYVTGVSTETSTETNKETKKEGVCTVELKVLNKGAKGKDVIALQKLLIGYGFSCGSYGADGDFGSGTLKAVKAFQKANGLAVDGIVGPASWGRLLGVN